MPERDLTLEKQMPRLGHNSYRSCPFAGEPGAKPECPRMAAILQRTRMATASAMVVNKEAQKMLKMTKEFFNRT
jgi:hypothetical protein